MCDKITECDGGIDEGRGCEDQENISNIVVYSSSFLFLSLYFCLRIWRCVKRKLVEDRTEPLLKLNFQSVLDQYKLNHENTDIIEKINLYFIFHMFSDDESKDCCKELFNSELQIHHEDSSEVMACIHQNLCPDVSDFILKFKSEPQSKATSKQSYTTKSFVKSERKLGIKVWDFCLSCLKIEKGYIDLLKDLTFNISIFMLIGGINTIIFYPTKFASIIVVFLLCSIFVPLFLSTVHLAIENPGMIFGEIETDNLSTFRRKVYRTLVLIISIFNPILLLDTYEQNKISKKRRAVAKDPSVLEVFKQSKKIQIQLVKFHKIELATEAFAQIPMQILLMLLSKTSTPTTGGLETVFEESSFLGINNIYISLLVSIIWSIYTCVDLHLTEISTEKGHLPNSSKLIVFAWGFFATVRRVTAIVSFFIPSMGLFNILHHWQVEQVPFQPRLSYAKQFNVTDNDKIALFNMSKTVYWNELDNWSYNGTSYTPPHYSNYSGMKLGHMFISFFVLTGFQLFIIYIVKRKTVRDFKKDTGLNQFIHILENVNIPIPYKDWDYLREQQKPLSKEDFKKKFKSVMKEMVALYLTNFLFTIPLLIPLWFTSKS